MNTFKNLDDRLKACSKDHLMSFVLSGSEILETTSLDSILSIPVAIFERAHATVVYHSVPILSGSVVFLRCLLMAGWDGSRTLVAEMRMEEHLKELKSWDGSRFGWEF